ncbi:MAG: DUF2239 family protein [Janthinobacterium lividum]
MAAFVAFAGTARIAAGTLADTAIAAKRVLERDHHKAVLVFDTKTGAVMDLDLRGIEAEVVARYAPAPPSVSERGRPKLSVVAREVTLLPRHWEWLARQPGGASVVLRRPVETARKLDVQVGAPRERVEATYRFTSAVAGDLAGFEEASRALSAHDQNRLKQHIRTWSRDVREQLLGYLNNSGKDT